MRRIAESDSGRAPGGSGFLSLDPLSHSHRRRSSSRGAVLLEDPAEAFVALDFAMPRRTCLDSLVADSLVCAFGVVVIQEGRARAAKRG